MRRIFCVVFGIHLAVISGICLSGLSSRLFPPKKEIPFKVKLGASTPSRGPVVGPPERTRPRPAAPKAEPKPVVPKPEPKPEPKPVVPKPEPKPVVPKPKPVPKSRPKPKTTPKRNAKPEPRIPAPKPKTPVAKPPKKPESRTEREQREVYRPPAGANNFNPNVPIGSRNAAQLHAPKSDNRTPQGGLTPDEEAYNGKLRSFLYAKWVQPNRILLGDELPSAVIEIEIDGAGNVRSAKIAQPSGNRTMDESVRRLLAVLDRLPAPPGGRARTLAVMLKAEE